LEDFKERAIRGIKWNIIEQVVVYLTVFAGTVILSRILLPEHFGLFGMLTVLGNLATLIIGMGLSYSVIHNQELQPEDLSTIFWFNLALGFFMAVVFFLGAPLIASFYHQPELVVVARLFCFGFIAQGANAVSVGLLIKSMKFKRLAFSNISGGLIAYSVSISMAVGGLGVWSLVAHFLVLHTVIVVSNLLLAKWVPAVDFRFSALQKVKKFSSNFLGSQLVDFTANNLDSVLIGKYIGKRDLGLFGRASALVTVPVTSLGYVLNRTLFPWFSALQNNVDDLRFRYNQSLKILILTIMPILVLVGLQAEDLVLLLFGIRWIAIAPYVTLLAVIGCFQCINSFNDSFVISQGRSDILLIVSILEKSLLVAGVIIGIRYGVTGVILAKISVLALIFIPRIITVCKLIQSNLFQWFRNIAALMAGLLLLTVVALLAINLFEDMHYAGRLFLVSLVSVGMYYLYLHLTRNTSLNEIKRIVRDQVIQLFSYAR
jgi:O-antigen/teichoic acid export membrane protein